MESSGNNTGQDHSYSCSSKKKKSVKTKGKQNTMERSEKIKSAKDMQNKHNVVEKRFKTKIETKENAFQCRSRSEMFPSKVEALVHVKTPFCKISKKKQGPKLKKCFEEGCGMSFLYAPDLRKHRKECHNDKFECPDCKKPFVHKCNYIRHLKECRKVGKQYECSKCSFVSFRKDLLQSHDIEQHLKKTLFDHSNVSQRPMPGTIIHNGVYDRVSCIASGQSMKLFSTEKKYCSTIKCYGSKNFNYEIKNIASHGQYILVIGQNDCTCLKVNLSDDMCTLEDVTSIRFDIEIKTANILDNKVAILFEKSVEIHELDSGNKVILSSVSTLVDMSLDKSDKILFVLREGFIKKIVEFGQRKYCYVEF